MHESSGDFDNNILVACAQIFSALILDRAVPRGTAFNAAHNDAASKLMGLNQVGLWGAESGDEMGNGESYDGDGVGVNTSAEANHPYAAVAPRQRSFGAVQFH
eukprot:CAMPEP_0179456488 /NCGR_PEP_ID=MMETSP0799-20121207/40318_1 /TAXON_ID=46947 /ORGANISM="Geminigera cryophila, Strain CCMP2564" /LENGTH=102 /DNA_ID=CAMNT_0021256349 /DNA_START=365 /DNA_END=674 /DNA_ORIENTATION=-